jgi:glycine/D-amino acid oxidase-like deaminating enzyme
VAIASEQARVTGVYWQDPPGPSRASLDGDLSVDVAIVGGGNAGLATAWHLTERGLSSAVLDARTVASGASGRNGGFLIAGAAPMYNDACDVFGRELARRIYAATLEAQARVYEIAADVGAAGAFRRVGLLRLAVDAAEAGHVRAHAAALARDGFPGRLVAADDLPAPLRRDDRLGLLTEHDAGVHPVHWLTALAAELERRGVRIFERTAVRVDRDRGLVAPAGTVRFGALVVAADAGIGALLPEFAGRVRARRLHMIATSPLATDHVRQPVYARYGYEYHQQLPDGRIVLGGFSDLDGADSYTEREESSEVVHARLARYLVDDLGVDAPVTHRWVGTVGYTDDHRPFAGSVPGREGVYGMGGYCGTGNLCGWVAARIVADQIATGARVDADLFDASR